MTRNRNVEAKGKVVDRPSTRQEIVAKTLQKANEKSWTLLPQLVILNFHFSYVIWYLIGSDNISKWKCKMWSFRYYVALNHVDAKFTMKSNSKQDARKQMKEVFHNLYIIDMYIHMYISLCVGFKSFTSLVKIIGLWSLLQCDNNIFSRVLLNTFWQV